MRRSRNKTYKSRTHLQGLDGASGKACEVYQQKCSRLIQQGASMAMTTGKNPHNLQTELHRDLNLLILAITFGMAYMTVYNGPSLNAFIRSLGAGDFVFAVIMAMPVFTGL